MCTHTVNKNIKYQTKSLANVVKITFTKYFQNKTNNQSKKQRKKPNNKQNQYFLSLILRVE